jgi:hypothetical protein
MKARKLQDNQLTGVEINVRKTEPVFLSCKQNAAYNNKVLVNEFSEEV